MNDPQPIKESPGRRLASLRAERGMTLEEVARHLKFAPRQIEALEQDDYAALPGATIVRGMIRSYAKLLNIDAEPLIADVRQRLAPSNQPEMTRGPRSAMSVPFPTRRRESHPYVWMTGGLIIVLALLASADALLGSRKPAVVATDSQAVAVAPAKPEPIAPPVAAPEPAQAVSAEPPPSVAEPARLPPGMKRIVLKFERSSWVEVRSANGAVLLSQLNPAGTEKTLEGTGPFALVIGAATGVQLSYNNEQVDLMPHTRVDVARLTLN